MKKFFLNYRNDICLAVTVGCILCTVFLFPKALFRLTESIRDIGLSAAYYFCFLFNVDTEITPTVSEFSAVLTQPAFLPDSWEGFSAGCALYLQRLFNAENFAGYMAVLGDGLYRFALFLTVILPLAILAVICFQRYMEKQNNRYDQDGKCLSLWRRIMKKVYLPVKNWWLDSIDFLKQNAYWGKIWAGIWLFNFNLITIGIEFLAYYFYFVASFDVLHIYRQIYKLFVDLSVMVKVLPIWAWVGVIAFFFGRFRKKIGMARLRHFENRNKGFINERPLVTMVCGTMGTGKTTVITDMALSEEGMLRDKAFELILKNDLKFPYFPWINLENDIKRAMEYHQVYNLATCRVFVEKKFARWGKKRCKGKLFGYDHEQYGLYHDDKLKVENVWQVIEKYAQLYFIYVIQSSVIVSNYAIRTDAVLSDAGNFPLWNNDFFARDSKLMEAYSRHSKILDFDSLRLGQKVLKENPYKDSFEFGVVAITEIGKERKNTLELQGTKRKDEETNQKNDLFNIALKMIRHPATVDNFPFVKVITDEQRPESWGADARDLCEIVHIKSVSEPDIAMPFFDLEYLLYDWFFSRFQGLYYRYRFNRGDNTLPIYLFKSLTAKLYHYYHRTLNLYGIKVCSVETEAGTQTGKRKDKKYYLMTKKIYANRFSTDCYKGFFEEKSLRSPVGITDLPEYSSEVATMSELQRQNSYFIADLTNIKENK